MQEAGGSLSHTYFVVVVVAVATWLTSQVSVMLLTCNFPVVPQSNLFSLIYCQSHLYAMLLLLSITAICTLLWQAKQLSITHSFVSVIVVIAVMSMAGFVASDDWSLSLNGVHHSCSLLTTNTKYSHTHTHIQIYSYVFVVG